ncbi:MAG: molybdopterin-guanine dinucleotide biosynthesis protein B [Caldimicrobium thiodismutans]
MSLIIALCGYHNSGKTTLGTYLVKELRERGYKVAVIKSTKEEGNFTDKPGTDTFRYRESGAEAVGLFQKDLLTLYFTEFPKDEDFLSFLQNLFWDKDLILLEGFKSFPYLPKIWVLKDKEDKEEIRKKYPGIELFIRAEDIGISLEFLLSKLKEKEKTVLLYVNGKEIQLKPFIQKILGEMLFGFLKGLKNIPERISHFEIKIKL